jgi:hypothetical protein
MALFEVIDNSVRGDTFYGGMVKDATNWDTLEDLFALVTAQTVFGKLTGGDLKGLSVSELQTLLTLGTAAYQATTAFDAAGTGHTEATAHVATHAALTSGVHGLGTMAAETATDYVTKALFDANTVLAADSDNTPAAVTIAEQKVVGRITGGNIKGLSTTELTGLVDAASTTASGKIEVAIASEVNTGNDATRAVSPDSLAGSNFGTKTVEAFLNASIALTTDDKVYFRIPSTYNGMNLVSVAAMCKVASTSGTPTFTIKNGATSMLSVNLTIDENETDSSTAATAATIDTGHDEVATGNQIEVACTVAGTGVTYAVVELQFQLP